MLLSQLKFKSEADKQRAFGILSTIVDQEMEPEFVAQVADSTEVVLISFGETEKVFSSEEYKEKYSEIRRVADLFDYRVVVAHHRPVIWALNRKGMVLDADQLDTLLSGTQMMEFKECL